jgi:hypothetical protein
MARRTAARPPVPTMLRAELDDAVGVGGEPTDAP